MNQRPNDPALETPILETTVLRGICVVGISEAARAKVIELLRSYEWLDEDRREIFQVICTLVARGARDILAHLKAELTRRGFPDIPCDWLAQSAANACDSELLREAEKLIRAATVRR